MNVSQIIVNGVNYQGSSIVISNGNININGVDVVSDEKVVNVVVTGNVDKLDLCMCDEVTINGEIKQGNIQSTSGNIKCNDVSGNVNTTSGEVECGDVGGSVKTTSGDVNCNYINGDVRTVSGDINN